MIDKFGSEEDIFNGAGEYLFSALDDYHNIMISSAATEFDKTYDCFYMDAGGEIRCVVFFATKKIDDLSQKIIEAEGGHVW